MAERKQGPPDLKKPFIKSGSKKKKQPEPEPEPQDDELNEVVEWSESEDDLPQPGEEPITQQEFQRGFAPSQPPQQYQDPNEQDPYALLMNEISKLNTANHAHSINNDNFIKLLSVFKKYLEHNRTTVKNLDEIVSDLAEGLHAVQQQPKAIAPPEQEKPKGIYARMKANQTNGEVDKKKKLGNVLMLGLGVLMLGGAFYLGTMIDFPIVGIGAFIIAGLGGGFLAVGVRG